MTYQEALQQPEWQLKRQEILERDKEKCTLCHKIRTEFRGLDKSFGIIEIKELNEKGYSQFHPSDLPVSHDKLFFINTSFVSKVNFIGSATKSFDINTLKFAQQWQDVQVFGIIKKQARLICFYPETLQANGTIDLNIHHTYYIEDRKPWEYENSALITLCMDCHRLTHEQTEIVVYSEKREQLYNTSICDRCEGSGYMPEFDYFQNGICFKCGGEGAIV